MKSVLTGFPQGPFSNVLLSEISLYNLENIRNCL